MIRKVRLIVFLLRRVCFASSLVVIFTIFVQNETSAIAPHPCHGPDVVKDGTLNIAYSVTFNEETKFFEYRYEITNVTTNDIKMEFGIAEDLSHVRNHMHGEWVPKDNRIFPTRPWDEIGWPVSSFLLPPGARPVPPQGRANLPDHNYFWGTMPARGFFVSVPIEINAGEQIVLGFDDEHNCTFQNFAYVAELINRNIPIPPPFNIVIEWPKWALPVPRVLETLITLSSFTATTEKEKVLLEWITEVEIDNFGFNILRSEAKEGPYTKINDTLIQAEGGTLSGVSYDFRDTTVENGETYFYKLEDIDIYGTSTLHGPIKITTAEGHGALLNKDNKSSAWGGGCGFVKPKGYMGPPSNGQITGALLPFFSILLLLLIRHLFRYKNAYGKPQSRFSQTREATF